MQHLWIDIRPLTQLRLDQRLTAALRRGIVSRAQRMTLTPALPVFRETR